MKVEMLSGTETLRMQAELTTLLADAVGHGSSIGFMVPVGPDDLESYWREVAGEVASGRRLLLVALDDRRKVMGSGQIVFDPRDDGAHRAGVQKVVVRHALRGRGIGAALMVRLEFEASRAGRTLIYLDTTAGAQAAGAFYRRLGYRHPGSATPFAGDPATRLAPNTLFFKELSFGDVPVTPTLPRSVPSAGR
jgi:GNAT superfamily N-acetyltransferase